MDWNNGTIGEFTPKQLKVGGYLPPKVYVPGGTQTENEQIIFGPAS